MWGLTPIFEWNWIQTSPPYYQRKEQHKINGLISDLLKTSKLSQSYEQFLENSKRKSKVGQFGRTEAQLFLETYEADFCKYFICCAFAPIPNQKIFWKLRRKRSENVNHWWQSIIGFVNSQIIGKSYDNLSSEGTCNKLIGAHMSTTQLL